MYAATDVISPRTLMTIIHITYYTGSEDMDRRYTKAVIWAAERNPQFPIFRVFDVGGRFRRFQLYAGRIDV